MYPLDCEITFGGQNKTISIPFVLSGAELSKAIWDLVYDKKTNKYKEIFVFDIFHVLEAFKNTKKYLPYETTLFNDRIIIS